MIAEASVVVAIIGIYRATLPRGRGRQFSDSGRIVLAIILPQALHVAQKYAHATIWRVTSGDERRASPIPAPSVNTTISAAASRLR